MEIGLIDDILSEWKNTIDSDYDGYRNHVCRMVIFCLNIEPYTEEEKNKICIAAAFHDIGIWVENTVDYAEHSVPPALEYLKENNLEDWSAEISLMISEHHKVTPYRGQHEKIVERFRKADLIDFSFGIVRHGLSKKLIKDTKDKYPNEGFHKSLIKKLVPWIMKHPLNPMPMMKW